ncbi:hypothetical protein ABEG63_04295 [Chryseobacterium sp. C39-AII1]|uniref:hypothetical protein n=1 Tax=Chryseobacterium sp. C39-AII1 TaxID=3080332 RepID=UPI003207C8AB
MRVTIEKLSISIKEKGWDSYKSLKKELLTYNTKDLIVEILNANNFRNSDTRSLLLIIPELWKDFSLEDWKYIIRKVNRPSIYRLYIDNSSQFEDIRFLYNWIGIDSVSLYKNDSLISKENKQALDKVFPAYLIDPMRDGGLYKEDFQDGTFGNIDYFRKMKHRLISQGAKPNPMGNL